MRIDHKADGAKAAQAVPTLEAQVEMLWEAVNALAQGKPVPPTVSSFVQTLASRKEALRRKTNKQ